jgi:hypothetical protein
MKYIVGEGFFFGKFQMKTYIETLHYLKCSDTTDTREPSEFFIRG